MIGIVGALDEEILKLRSEVESPQKTILSGIKFVSGYLENHPVVVVKSGIGKVNAAICTQILITHFKVNRIIFTGVAGGINPELKIGDIVVSISTVQHDLDLSLWGREPGEAPSPQTQAYTYAIRRLEEPTIHMASADESLINSVERGFAALPSELRENRKMIRGIISSGDTFIDFSDSMEAPPSESDRARKGFADYTLMRLRNYLSADCVEMEGAALGHACLLADIPFVITRCISDLAGENAKVNIEKFLNIEAPNLLTALMHASLREIHQ